MKSLVTALLLTTLAATAQAGADFNVTAVGLSAYAIDGINNPTLNLVRGTTYVFAVSATGHPFFIKTARVTGTGSQFSTGVTGQGVTAGTLTFAVPASAPNTLFYQCSVHLSMGGTINITDPTGVGPGGVPKVLWLGPAIPNPTHEGALFKFGLPHAASIDFSVFDARGRLIKWLYAGSMPAGEHSLRWDGRDGNGQPVASGRYFYRLRVEGKPLNGQVVVTR